MCWADRIGIAWAIVVALFVLVIFNGEPIPGNAWVGWEALFALPVWIFFRLIDFITGGPWRRGPSVFSARVIR